MYRGFQIRLAKELGMKPAFLNHILRGRKKVSPRRALELERISGVPKEIWVWGTPEEIREELEKRYAGRFFKNPQNFPPK